MHRVSDVMSHQIASVTREETVSAAAALLRAEGAEAVLVLEEGRLIGLLEALRLSLFDGEVSVQEAMQPPALVVQADAPLAEVARRMREANIRCVPVLRGEELVGMLSERDLLTAWGSTTDALTGLAIQAHFRRWVGSQMAAEREITILFLDLDNFGQLNKQHGHVFGDEVLRCVARVLREHADAERDFVCRYGGDEFAVGTVRPVDEALRLASQLRDQVSRICVAGESGVSIAIGLAGGRRLRARKGTHIDAMLDALVTQASTASTHAKHSEEHITLYEPGERLEWRSEAAGADAEESPGSGISLQRLIVEDYQIGRVDQGVEVKVEIRSGEDRYAGTCVATVPELTRALVTATARCLEEAFEKRLAIQVEETYEYTTPRGLACVGVTVALAGKEGGTEQLVGAAPINGDVYRTYINAVLDATNRILHRHRATVIRTALTHGKRERRTIRATTVFKN